MNDAKLQAILDMYQAHGGDVTFNCAEFDELSCDEQMIVESMIELL